MQEPDTNFKLQSEQSLVHVALGTLGGAALLVFAVLYVLLILIFLPVIFAVGIISLSLEQRDE